jgi:hypothetical protein
MRKLFSYLTETCSILYCNILLPLIPCFLFFLPQLLTVSTGTSSDHGRDCLDYE